MSHIQSNFDCPVCGIAEKDIQFYGFSQCNHPICGVCAIKLQKFSKEKEDDLDYSKCVICKQDIAQIVIASKIQLYEDVKDKKMMSNNDYGLLFESKQAHAFYTNTVKIFCPKCSKVFQTIDELVLHVDEHKKRYCELCTLFNKCLISELEIFTDNDYHQHRNKKHPKCRFCDIRFYDDGHLIKHVKDAHFICDICHRNQGYVAYRTQNELLRHYAQDHFVCEICRNNNNINVFESEYGLKTHKVSAHAHNLVHEGLVHVGFGDRDNQMKYGARRRAREADEDCFDSSTSSNVVEQNLPTMNCEQEFPRLGADTSSSQPLGMQAQSLDDNDARTAFSRRDPVPDNRDGDKQNQTPVNTAKPDNKMSNNFAISVKKSAGSLNSEDFPSLSSEMSRSTPAQDFSRVRNSVVMHSERSVASTSNDQDFPALSSRPGVTATAKSWKVAMKPPGSGSKIVNTVTVANNVRQTVPTQANRVDNDDPWFDHEATGDEVRRDVPKVTMISRDEFEQTNPKPKGNARQKVPAEHDFPSLGSSQAPIATHTGAKWGKQMTSADPKPVQPDPAPLAVGSVLDFPELPFKPLPKQSNHVPNKNNHKSAKPDPVPLAMGNVLDFPELPFKPLPKQDSHASKMNNQKTARPSNGTNKPKLETSVKPADSCPASSVAPISLVDSQQFSSIIRLTNETPAAAEHHGYRQQSSFSLADESDFPAVGPANNRFASLHDNSSNNMTTMSNALLSTNVNKKASTTAAKSVPIISSESDFPTLPSPQQLPSQPASSNRQKKKQATKREQKPKVEHQKPAPVVSLMDVAMAVANKSYTPFRDADERNQDMFVQVYENLEPEVATELLRMSGMYRNRQMTASDYIDRLLSSQFANDRTSSLLATIMPQMCVLLPDIPLQRCLMEAMPRPWIAELRQCLKCQQVLHRTDIDQHNELAH